jgi:hypothetical protein
MFPTPLSPLRDLLRAAAWCGNGIVYESIGTRGSEMKPITLYDLFESAVQKYPTNLAVCFKTATCTTAASYKDVLGECEKIYESLIEFDVKCRFIGVCMDQTLCLPTVFLG